MRVAASGVSAPRIFVGAGRVVRRACRGRGAFARECADDHFRQRIFRAGGVGGGGRPVAHRAGDFIALGVGSEPMGRAKSALVSGVVSFAVGFAVASLVGDRKSGLKAGLLSAVIGAVIAAVVAGGSGDPDLEEIEELAEEVEVVASD